MSKDEKPLGELIDKMLELYKLKGKMRETDLVASWETMMGRTIAKHTTKIYMKEGVLHVHLDSSTLRQELGYARSRMIELVNRHLGSGTITDVQLH